jgi:hypothetical protein
MHAIGIAFGGKAVLHSYPFMTALLNKPQQITFIMVNKFMTCQHAVQN